MIRARAKSKPCSPEQEPLDNNPEIILDNYFGPQTYNKETILTKFIPKFTLLIADLFMPADKKKEELQTLTSKTAYVVSYLVNNLQSILSDNLEPQFLDNMEEFFRIVTRSTLPNSLPMIPEKDFAADLAFVQKPHKKRSRKLSSESDSGIETTSPSSDESNTSSDFK